MAIKYTLCRENEQSINKSSLLKFEESLNIAINRFYYDVPLVKINTEHYSPSEYSNGFLENL